jgi:hypothetical protein
MYQRQYSSDLSKAFSGTDADLEANRRGYLTSRQMDNLPFRSDAHKNADFGSAVKTALTAIAGGLLAFAFFAFLLGHAEELIQMVPVTLRPMAFGLIVVAVISAMIWLSYAAVRQNRASRNWESSKLATMRVDGMISRVQPIIDRVDGEEHVYLEANGCRLMTNKRMLKAFRPGRQYHLYYIDNPSGMWLVNAEEMPQSE